jgi:peptidoglycan/xylan/chitin deacetylase (PgdA/CDA1 family)
VFDRRSAAVVLVAALAACGATYPPPRTFARSTAAVPILVYHVIAAAPAAAPFPGLYLAPTLFAGQMRALARAGYHAVTLDAVRSAWAGRGPLPPHPIVLSFDNGYRTQYTRALPVLRRLRWVGVENVQLTGLPPAQGGLSPQEVRGLIAAGWELDTQGWSHADLVRLAAPALRHEVLDARRVLQGRYGVPVSWFCYPSGHYDAVVVAEVRRAGYVGATTVVPGWARPNADRYRLPRLRVLGGTTPQELLALVADTRAGAPPPTAYPPGS